MLTHCKRRRTRITCGLPAALEPLTLSCLSSAPAATCVVILRHRAWGEDRGSLPRDPSDGFSQAEHAVAGGMDMLGSANDF